MLHTATKRLEIFIDNDFEISELDHYTWIFTSRIFRLALEIIALGLEKFLENNKRQGGRLGTQE